MEAMPHVLLHGQVSQARLAELMRAANVFVLPSYYEGLPLVLVEAAASGCRVVATDLPGVRELADALGPWLDRVQVPRLERVDQPVADDLPDFVARLSRTLRDALCTEAPTQPPDLRRWTWRAVFRRVEDVWCDLLG
jgi:glycosyltransferase involved in cell wall biosynthesis